MTHHYIAITNKAIVKNMTVHNEKYSNSVQKVPVSGRAMVVDIRAILE